MNGSTKIQSFVYHFVENFKLLHENVNFFRNFQNTEVTAVRSDHGAILDMYGISKG